MATPMIPPETRCSIGHRVPIGLGAQETRNGTHIILQYVSGMWEEINAFRSDLGASCTSELAAASRAYT